jgi:hypothetical protein
MDGRRVALVLLVAACSGRGARGPALPGDARVLARGSLAYAAVATAGAVVTLELEERFALIVRDPDSGRARTTVDLGAAERDLVALAVHGDTAWVGGDDHAVRTVDLARGAVTATWPIGAPVTALRWLDGGWLAIGDATGTVCLRRLADAALLQCATLAADPVSRLSPSADGSGLVVESGSERTAWTLPALARTTAVPPPRRWRGGEITVAGREVRAGTRVVASLGERVRMVEVGPRGELIIAAWITRLDDPSVIVLP